MLDLLNADRRPGVTADAKGFLDRIDALLPEIRARAAETERTGRVSDEMIAALTEAGVFRAVQPRQWGGLELDHATFYEGMVRIASACGSTGWVSSVVGIHPWQIALFANEAQRDVWESDPGRACVIVAGAYRIGSAGAWWISVVRSLAFLQRCRSLRMGTARRYHPG